MIDPFKSVWRKARRVFRNATLALRPYHTAHKAIHTELRTEGTPPTDSAQKQQYGGRVFYTPHSLSFILMVLRNANLFTRARPTVKARLLSHTRSLVERSRASQKAAIRCAPGVYVQTRRQTTHRPHAASPPRTSQTQAPHDKDRQTDNKLSTWSNQHY